MSKTIKLLGGPLDGELYEALDEETIFKAIEGSIKGTNRNTVNQDKPVGLKYHYWREDPNQKGLFIYEGVK